MSSLSDDVTGIEKLYEESVQPGSIPNEMKKKMEGQQNANRTNKEIIEMTNNESDDGTTEDQPFENCAGENGFCECQEGGTIAYGALNWIV